MSRLTNGMSVEEGIAALADNHPGALVVCVRLFELGPRFLLLLDKLDIFGIDIFGLYRACQENESLVCCALFVWDHDQRSPRELLEIARGKSSLDPKAILDRAREIEASS